MRILELKNIAILAAKQSGANFPNAGKLNAYTCQGKRGAAPGSGLKLVQTEPPCGHTMITIDREPGMTPFITRCPNCGGETQSAMYRIMAGPGTVPTHEWYRPDNFDGLNAHTKHHVRQGGLLLREIPQAGTSEATPEPQHRHPEWVRFTGDIALLGISAPGLPTVGIAPDICDDCDTRRVLIACVSDSGHECNVGVSPEEAFRIADQITAAALRVIETKGKH